MNMRIGLPFSCSFVGKSWYVLVMSMIRFGAYVRSTLPRNGRRDITFFSASRAEL